VEVPVALDMRLLRSPKEPPLFAIGVAISVVAWLVLAVTIVGALYGCVILAFILFAHALFLAHVKGNGVRISERQLPHLYARVTVAAEKLGMAQVPDVYLLQSGGLLNAFATKLLSRNFVIIYSSLADSCQDSRQLDFIIGHELGHLAAGHLKWNGLLAPYRLVPWLGPAYSRAREYTCDRCGLAVAGDLEQSTRGLAVLAAGGKAAASVDLAAFEEQRLESGSFWMSVMELVSSHPFLCKRAAALREYQRPGTVQPVARNVVAYFLAPFFGVAAAPAGGAGAGLMVLAMVGFLSAMGIFGVRKYIEAAKQASFGGQENAIGTDSAAVNPYATPRSMVLPLGSAVDYTSTTPRPPPPGRLDPNRRRVTPQP
jgi:Zn-dependent protease with chaperone function